MDSKRISPPVEALMLWAATLPSMVFFGVGVGCTIWGALTAVFTLVLDPTELLGPLKLLCAGVGMGMISFIGLHAGLYALEERAERR